MANLRLFFEETKAGRTFERNMKAAQDQVRSRMLKTAQEAASQILVKGRSDISSAGRYGARWTSGLQASVQGDSVGDSISVVVSHNIPYFKGLLKNQTITGRPLLWIPMSSHAGSKPSDFGKLVKVERQSGAPLLMDPVSKEVLFHGQTEVNIPKKFHTLEIIREVASKLASLYRAQPLQ